MTVERATKNFGWVFGLYLARRGVRLIYFAAFARIMAEQVVGSFYFLLQIVPLLLSVGMMGLGVYLIRELSARKKDEAPELIGRSMGFGLAGSVVPIIVFMAVAPFTPYGADVRLGMAIISLVVIPRALILMLYSVSTAYERQNIYAVLENVAPIVEAAVGLTLLLCGFGLVALCATHTAVYALYAIVFFCLVRRRIVRFRVRFEPRTWGEIFRGSRLMWVYVMLTLMAASLGVIILSGIAGNEQVGRFAVAMALVEVMQAAATMFGSAVFPYMVRAWQRSAEEFRSFLDISLRLIAVLAVPLGFATVILAEPALALIFGPKYTASAPVLRILAWLVFPVFFEQIATQVCFSANRPGYPVIGHAILNASRIGMAVALVLAMRERAAEGLAWALLASALVGLATYIVIISRIAGNFGALRGALRLAAASAAPVAATWFGFGRVSPWLLAPIAVILFAAGAAAFRFIGRKEIDLLRRALLAFRTRTPAESADTAASAEETEA